RPRWRVDLSRAVARAHHALRGAPGRPPLTAAGARGAVRRLLALAARAALPGGPGALTGVLALPAGRPAGARPAHRPRSPRPAELRGRAALLRALAPPDGGAALARAARGHQPVHDPAGRVRGPAPAPDGPGRRRPRHRQRRARPGRDRT